jgi:C-terminal associated domain of TOPRIM
MGHTSRDSLSTFSTTFTHLCYAFLIFLSSLSRLSFGYVVACEHIAFVDTWVRLQVFKGEQVINFYTIPEYEQWLESTPGTNRWFHKYYKACNSHLIMIVGSHLLSGPGNK